MKRTKLWLAASFASVIALVLLALFVQQAILIRKLKRELERLRQEGEPLRLSDLLPPVQPKQDGTIFYQAAIQQLEATEKQLPQSLWDNLDNFLSPRPTRPVNLADVGKALKAVEPALTTLRKALTYPHMRLVNWQVENPAMVLLPHFSKFREFSRLLAAEALWRKRKGDIDGALESCATSLRLVRRMGDEPAMVLGFLVQNSIFATSLGAMQRVLVDADASPQAYRSLLRELKAWNIDRDFVRALQMERVCLVWMCDWMKEKASRMEINALFHQSFLHPPEVVELSLWLKPKATWIAQNELIALQRCRQVIALARRDVPYDWSSVAHLERMLELEHERECWCTPNLFSLGGLSLSWHPKALVTYFLNPSLDSIFYKAATSHALQRLGVTAIALRLYRQEHGRYPKNLPELVPRYLPSVPVDPFDGKPLRYRREGKGFRLWSIGQDMKDDDGTEEQPRWIKGDIVWVAVR